MCDAHGSVDVHDHLPTGLVAFAVVGSLLLLLQHAVSRGSVLQRKLAEDFTEPVDADLSHAVGRMTEEQQEGMEPGRRMRTFNFIFCTERSTFSALLDKLFDEILSTEND